MVSSELEVEGEMKMDEGQAYATYTAFEAIQVKGPIQSPNKLARQLQPALFTYSHLATAGATAVPWPGHVPVIPSRVDVPVRAGSSWRARIVRQGRRCDPLVWCHGLAPILPASLAWVSDVDLWRSGVVSVARRSAAVVGCHHGGRAQLLQ